MKRRGKADGGGTVSDSDLVGTIYQTVLEPELWEAVLTEMKLRLGAAGTFLVHTDLVNKSANILQSKGFSEKMLDDYGEHWTQHDPGHPLVRARPIGEALATSQFYGKREWERTTYCNEFSIPNHLSDQLGARLFEDRGRFTFVGNGRELGDAPFSASNVHFLQSLVPHLQRALQVARYCADLHGQLDSAAMLLERIGTAVILLDGEGRILHANRKAEGLLAGPLPLTGTHRRLSVGEPAERSRLDELVRDAVAVAAEGDSAETAAIPGGAMLITLSEGRRLQVLVSPVSTERHGLGWAAGTVRAMVLLREPEAPAAGSPEWLQVLYGLTSAEARLAAALAEGHTLTDASEQFAITRETARSQLKAVFDKTGARRQAELVRLVLTHPAALFGSQ